MIAEATKYEILTKELHEALLKNDGVENINVLHNVKIKGRSGASHQIDVYWEFRLAGVRYKTCIECKQLNNTVKKSHLAAFAAILDDLGNTTGIFATTIGFQKGAVQLAKEKGIRLVLVNSLIKTVGITYHVSRPDTYITDVKYDMEQAKERLCEKGLSEFSFQTIWERNTKFFNEKGEFLTTLDDFMKKYALSNDGVIEPESVYDLLPIGLLRIKSIKYHIAMFSHQFTDEIKTNDTSRAILEDVLENCSFYLNDDLSITKADN